MNFVYKIKKTIALIITYVFVCQYTLSAVTISQKAEIGLAATVGICSFYEAHFKKNEEKVVCISIILARMARDFLHLKNNHKTMQDNTKMSLCLSSYALIKQLFFSSTQTIAKMAPSNTWGDEFDNFIVNPIEDPTIEKSTEIDTISPIEESTDSLEENVYQKKIAFLLSTILPLIETTAATTLSLISIMPIDDANKIKLRYALETTVLFSNTIKYIIDTNPLSLEQISLICFMLYNVFCTLNQYINHNSMYNREKLITSIINEKMTALHRNLDTNPAVRQYWENDIARVVDINFNDNIQIIGNCPICFENNINLYTSECNHSTCINCMRDHINENGITIRNVSQLTCQADGCNRLLTETDIRRIDFLSEANQASLINGYRDALFTEWTNSQAARSLRICPIAECPGVFTNITNSRDPITCTICNNRFCRNCMHNHTASTPCIVAQNIIDNDELYGIDVVRCPVCTRPTQRTIGCNHMTCRNGGGNCPGEFCYVCGGIWDDNHRRAGYTHCSSQRRP